MAIRKGFSLIEISITIAVFTLIVSGMLGIFAQGFSYLKQSKERTIAYNLAREKLEECSSVFPANGIATEDYSTITSFPDFRRVVTVNDYLYLGQLKQITVTVYWNNDAENQSVVTLKANF